MTTTQNIQGKAKSSLTDLQLELLSFYREYYKEHKRWPRLIEASEHFDTDHRYISSRAYNLVNKGYFKKVYDGMFEVTRKK